MINCWVSFRFCLSSNAIFLVPYLLSEIRGRRSPFLLLLIPGINRGLDSTALRPFHYTPIFIQEYENLVAPDDIGALAHDRVTRHGDLLGILFVDGIVSCHDPVAFADRHMA